MMNSISTQFASLSALLVLLFATTPQSQVYGQCAALPEKSGGGKEQPGTYTGGMAPDIRLLCGWEGQYILEDAFVTISGPVSVNLNKEELSHFDLGSLPAGTYTLSGAKDAAPLNGVNTLDLIRTAKHLMNIEPFEYPWQWVAADVNRSNSVTAYDLWLLRQWMLGRYAELPENESYRFVDPNHIFPFPFPLEDPVPDSRTFFWDPAHPTPVSFELAGIKIGDVDATAACTFSESLAALPAMLQIQDAKLAEGETIDLPFSLSTNADLLGFQFAMRVDPGKLEIETILENDLPNLDADVFAEPIPGLLTVIWYDVYAQRITPDRPILTIRLRALKPVRLQEAIRFEPTALPAQAYNAASETIDLELGFRDKSIGMEGKLLQNSVYLNEASAAQKQLLENDRGW